MTVEDEDFPQANPFAIESGYVDGFVSHLMVSSDGHLYFEVDGQQCRFDSSHAQADLIRGDAHLRCYLTRGSIIECKLKNSIIVDVFLMKPLES